MPERMSASDESNSSTGAALTSTAPTTSTVQGNAITQELVEKLADKVFALLLDDLRNEAERYRLPSRKLEGRRSIFGSAGGW